MARSISNSDDIIDSRDVIARISELEDEIDDWKDGSDDWAANFPDDAEELKALRALVEAGEGLSDWRHGVALIRESYFEDYARQFAEDIGAMENCDSWPATCIDWERAANELQMDYSAVDFDGVTYYARS
jgi:exoribonuclease II